jgi:hypothetical protein
MKSIHLVIPDLFLPKDIAEEVVAGLSLPALQKMLGRGHGENLDLAPLEILLCEMFGITYQHDVPIAPVSAVYDGLTPGCWLRADPVHLDLQRDRLLLDIVQVGGEEAEEMCASLNGHFAGQGMEFLAPHPQRWYVRLQTLPSMRTTPLSQVVGNDVRMLLPVGSDAGHWHRVFNEIQMLLHAHPVNDSREARGEPTINSVWFWGGGCDTLLAKPADCGNSRKAASAANEEAVAASKKGGCGKNISTQINYDLASSDDVLTEMFARSAGIPYSVWPKQWHDDPSISRQLLVWTGLRSALQRGDLVAWRTALQDYESGYAQPLWQALKSGKIDRLQLDVLGAHGDLRVQMSRGDTRAFWRRSKRLAEYPLV